MTIVAATSVAIFSLGSVFGGAYAWFTVMLKRDVTASQFAVVNNRYCQMHDVELIKFVYTETVHGSGANEFVDNGYLNPENGVVHQYDFNKTENAFGYYEDSTWHEVSAMNTYDPVDLKVFSANLRGQNCNAVYKFTIASSDYTDIYLSSTVAKVLKTKEDDELFLTTCVDYDIFYESDLLDSNPLFIDGEDTKKYYPSFIDKSESMTDVEKIYHKISYLSSLKSTHAHFYGGSSNEISLEADKALSFTYDSVEDTNLLTVYVNVNYSPSQLEYTQNLIYLGDIKAVYDFMFKFDVAERSGS